MDPKGQITLEIVLMLLIVINIYLYVSNPVADFSKAASRAVGVSAAAEKTVDILTQKANLVAISGDGATDYAEVMMLKDFRALSCFSNRIALDFDVPTTTTLDNPYGFGLTAILETGTLTYPALGANNTRSPITCESSSLPWGRDYTACFCFQSVGGNTTSGIQGVSISSYLKPVGGECDCRRTMVCGDGVVDSPNDADFYETCDGTADTVAEGASQNCENHCSSSCNCCDGTTFADGNTSVTIDPSTPQDISIYFPTGTVSDMSFEMTASFIGKPPQDVIFLIDTSQSFVDTWQTMCRELQQSLRNLRRPPPAGKGYDDLQYRIFGMGPTPDGGSWYTGWQKMITDICNGTCWALDNGFDYQNNSGGSSACRINTPVWRYVNSSFGYLGPMDSTTIPWSSAPFPSLVLPPTTPSYSPPEAWAEAMYFAIRKLNSEGWWRPGSIRVIIVLSDNGPLGNRGATGPCVIIPQAIEAMNLAIAEAQSINVTKMIGMYPQPTPSNPLDCTSKNLYGVSTEYDVIEMLEYASSQINRGSAAVSSYTVLSLLAQIEAFMPNLPVFNATMRIGSYETEILIYANRNIKVILDDNAIAAINQELALGNNPVTITFSAPVDRLTIKKLCYNYA